LNLITYFFYNIPGEIYKNFFVNGASSYEFAELEVLIRELALGRLQLLTGALTLDQSRELKLQLTAKIDKKNRGLGLDLIPRVGYEVVDPVDVGPIKLFHVVSFYKFGTYH